MQPIDPSAPLAGFYRSHVVIIASQHDQAATALAV
jgi:hypothetical protein